MIHRLAHFFSTTAMLVFFSTLGVGQPPAPTVDDYLPEIRHFVAPEYPVPAWIAEVQGSTVTELIINDDGTVGSTTFISGLPIFRKSVETALKTWTFRVPTATNIKITTEFKLDANCPWTASPVADKRDKRSRIETQVFADLPAKIEVSTCSPTIETNVNNARSR